VDDATRAKTWVTQTWPSSPVTTPTPARLKLPKMLALWVAEAMNFALTSATESPTPTFSATACHAGSTSLTAARRLLEWLRTLRAAIAREWARATEASAPLEPTGARPAPLRRPLMNETSPDAGAATTTTVNSTVATKAQVRRSGRRRDETTPIPGNNNSP
jgi:hypothetical protein